MECIAVCPAENALQFSLMPRAASPAEESKPETIAARWRGRALKPWTVAAMLALVFFGLVGSARLAGHWQTNLSREIYMELIPNADQYDH
jgi:hypothetical protein